MAANIEIIMDEARQYVGEVCRELPVEKAVLFGSYTKEVADDFSDVDIAFFLRDFNGKTRTEIGVELLRLTHSYNAYFEPIFFSYTEIDRGNPFVMEIIKTGRDIVLHTL